MSSKRLENAPKKHTEPFLTILWENVKVAPVPSSANADFVAGLQLSAEGGVSFPDFLFEKGGWNRHRETQGVVKGVPVYIHFALHLALSKEK